MFSNTFGSGFQGTFCAVYGGLGALMPGDSAPPKGCGANDDVSYEAIRCPEIEQCQLKFSSTIANCWQDYQGYMTESETCQGWNVKTLDGGPLTEGMIHDEMEENDICPQQISCDAPDRTRSGPRSTVVAASRRVTSSSSSTVAIQIQEKNGLRYDKVIHDVLTA